MICSTAFRGFFDQNALLNDGARQARLDALDAVLHLDRGRLGVGAGNEIGGDFHLAEGIARRFEIEDAVGAIEFLFDQPRDAVVEIFRRGAGIAGADGDRGRRDDGILRDRQKGYGEQAAEADQQRDDPGENRAVDEESGHRSNPSAR
jgi:hypothetical protein